jgi:hypothetical protein
LCVEPELTPCVHLEKHTNSTNNTPIVIQKKILNEPLTAFPPSLRLKEPQTKLTSLIPPERLQEISWQDFWRSHAPGAQVLFRGSRWCSFVCRLVCSSVCRLVCSGKMARWTLPHEQPCYKLFYLTRQQLRLLRSLLCSDR